MAIAWLNKSKLDVGDLGLMHGLLCQGRERRYVTAPPIPSWDARLELEWGVPVVIISEQFNWRGKRVCEESRITLDALANRIDELSETFWQQPVTEYDRLLGLDVQHRLMSFEDRTKELLQQSWISSLLNRIRNYFSGIKRDSIKSMGFNFRRYTVQNFHEQFVKATSEFTRVPNSRTYTHDRSDSSFSDQDRVFPKQSNGLVLAREGSIFAKARSVLGGGVLRNQALNDVF